MSLTTHHNNWLKGSYQNDLDFLLKVAENDKLWRYPTNTEYFKPHKDS